MTTNFVILAAGRGTRIGRVGESLHKALVPLGGRAILSHLFALAPPDAQIIVCTGHREQQIMDYVELAHPDLPVKFVHVDGWDKLGGGPGHSLLAVKDEVLAEHDLVFTSCDTLWTRDSSLWEAETSWAGVAPMTVGTSPERWCRLRTRSSGRVARVLDKTPESPDVIDAYVGLAMIKSRDLLEFWEGVEGGLLVERERQVSGGLASLAAGNNLDTQHVHWTDVGDADAYKRAIIALEGYDWSKSEEATYVLKDTGRVVKFFADPDVAYRKEARSIDLRGAVPQVIDVRSGMMAYPYTNGASGYERLNRGNMGAFLEWVRESFGREPSENLTPIEIVTAARDFYYHKTQKRIAMLPERLQRIAFGCLSRIEWTEVCMGVEVVHWHGDLNFGNVVIGPGVNEFMGIDWRQDFSGYRWGDRRYDIAKLLIGCRMNWDEVRRGNFAPWTDGQWYEDVIREQFKPTRATECIAVLALLSSAPLHGSPLDEVLVAQAARWMENLDV